MLITKERPRNRHRNENGTTKVLFEAAAGSETFTGSGLTLLRLVPAVFDTTLRFVQNAGGGEVASLATPPANVRGKLVTYWKEHRQLAMTDRLEYIINDMATLAKMSADTEQAVMLQMIFHSVSDKIQPFLPHAGLRVIYDAVPNEARWALASLSESKPIDLGDHALYVDIITTAVADGAPGVGSGPDSMETRKQAFLSLLESYCKEAAVNKQAGASEISPEMFARVIDIGWLSGYLEEYEAPEVDTGEIYLPPDANGHMGQAHSAADRDDGMGGHGMGGLAVGGLAALAAAHAIGMAQESDAAHGAYLLRHADELSKHQDESAHEQRAETEFADAERLESEGLALEQIPGRHGEAAALFSEAAAERELAREDSSEALQDARDAEADRQQDIGFAGMERQNGSEYAEAEYADPEYPERAEYAEREYLETELAEGAHTESELLEVQAVEAAAGAEMAQGVEASEARVEAEAETAAEATGIVEGVEATEAAEVRNVAEAEAVEVSNATEVGAGAVEAAENAQGVEAANAGVEAAAVNVAEAGGIVGGAEAAEVSNAAEVGAGAVEAAENAQGVDAPNAGVEAVAGTVAEAGGIVGGAEVAEVMNATEAGAGAVETTEAGAGAVEAVGVNATETVGPGMTRVAEAGELVGAAEVEKQEAMNETLRSVQAGDAQERSQTAQSVNEINDRVKDTFEGKDAELAGRINEGAMEQRAEGSEQQGAVQGREELRAENQGVEIQNAENRNIENVSDRRDIENAQPRDSGTAEGRYEDLRVDEPRAEGARADDVPLAEGSREINDYLLQQAYETGDHPIQVDQSRALHDHFTASDGFDPAHGYADASDGMDGQAAHWQAGWHLPVGEHHLWEHGDGGGMYTPPPTMTSVPGDTLQAFQQAGLATTHAPEGLFGPNGFGGGKAAEGFANYLLPLGATYSLGRIAPAQWPGATPAKQDPVDQTTQAIFQNHFTAQKEGAESGMKVKRANFGHGFGAAFAKMAGLNPSPAPSDEG